MKDPRLQRLQDLIERQVAAHFSSGKDAAVFTLKESLTQHINNSIAAAWPAIMEEDGNADVRALLDVLDCFGGHD